MSKDFDARLAEIEQREQAATPGPWEMFRYRNGGGRIHLSGDDGRGRTLIADMDDGADQVATAYNEGDREFLFAAREDIPWLLSQLRDARANLATAEELNDEWHDREGDLLEDARRLRAELIDARAENERLREAAATWTKNALQAEAKVRAVEALCEVVEGRMMATAKPSEIISALAAAEQDEPKRYGQSQFVAPPTVSNADANRFSHWNKPVSQPTEGATEE